MNTQNNMSVEQQAFLYSYLTVNQFCAKYPAFKLGGVRAKIFNASENGLKSSGAVVWDGGKVLIHEARWFQHIEAQNKAGVQ